MLKCHKSIVLDKNFTHIVTKVPLKIKISFGTIFDFTLAL